MEEGIVDGFAVGVVADGAFAGVAFGIDGVVMLGDRIVGHSGEIDNIFEGMGVWYGTRKYGRERGESRTGVFVSHIRPAACGRCWRDCGRKSRRDASATLGLWY